MAATQSSAHRKSAAIEELTDLEASDGITRYFIAGEIEEYPQMKMRNFRRAITEANATTLLRNWTKSRSRPRPKVASGEVRVRQSKKPLTMVGVDVIVADTKTPVATRGRTEFLDGVPLLCVEILSPSNIHGDIVEKLEIYEKAKAPSFG